MSEAKSAEPVKVENPEAAQGNEIDGILKKNRELLDEKKKLQKEHEELKKRVQVEEEAKLAEQGKLKELLDAKTKRLNELEGISERIKRYDDRTAGKVEEIMKGLPEIAKEVFTRFQGDIDEKLDYVEKLSNEFKKKVPSIGSERPSSDGEIRGIELQKYRDMTPAQMIDFKYADPAAYKLIQDLLKKE